MAYDLDTTAGYMENAYHLARIARCAYADSPEERFPDLSTAFPTMVPIRKGRVFVLVLGNSEHTVIAFRGTDETGDWLESFPASQVAWGPGRVHRGLMKTLDSVWPQVCAALFDAGMTGALWVCGHSLGGSLALLATLRLEQEGFDPYSAMTFGAPPVLDKSAAGAIEASVYRFVNNEDFVPGIPWPSFLDTYVHAGEEVFLLPSGAIGEKRHSPDLARRIDRANTIGDGIIDSGPIYDHRMGNYIEKIGRNIASA